MRGSCVLSITTHERRCPCPFARPPPSDSPKRRFPCLPLGANTESVSSLLSNVQGGHFGPESGSWLRSLSGRV